MSDSVGERSKHLPVSGSKYWPDGHTHVPVSGFCSFCIKLAPASMHLRSDILTLKNAHMSIYILGKFHTAQASLLLSTQSSFCPLFTELRTMSAIDQVVFELQNFIVNDKASLNPVNLIVKGMEVAQKLPNMSGAEKKALVISALEKVAAGKDGVTGTDDDLIPQEVVASIRAVLEKNLVGDIIDVVADIVKGKFDLQKATDVAKDTVQVAVGCFKGLKLCFGKKK